MPSTGLSFSADGKTATLQMTNVSIIDQPRWPAMDAETTPAFIDFKLVFRASDKPVKYEDASRQYRFEGFKATAQLEATIRVPSIDFVFKTDALETSSCDFAVMGDEVNGKYYKAAKTLRLRQRVGPESLHPSRTEFKQHPYLPDDIREVAGQ